MKEYIGKSTVDVLLDDNAPQALKNAARIILSRHAGDGEGGRSFVLEDVMETGTQFWKRQNSRYQKRTVISNGESYFLS